MKPRILADESVDYRIVKKLRDEGFEVHSILESHPGLPDKDVLELSANQPALLLTEDRDFGEWVFAHKVKSVGVVYLRYRSDEVMSISRSLIDLLSKNGDVFYKKFVVIRVDKIRIRELP